MRSNLKNARKEKELTQTQMAKEFDITDRHYQRLEAGTSKGSVEFWEKAKNFFNAPSIDYLLEQKINQEAK